MLNTLYQFLSKPFSVLIVMIIGPILSIADRNYGYFFGLIIALFMLWKSGWIEAKFGFNQKLSYRTVGRGLLIAVAIFL